MGSVSSTTSLLESICRICDRFTHTLTTPGHPSGFSSLYYLAHTLFRSLPPFSFHSLPLLTHIIVIFKPSLISFFLCRAICLRRGLWRGCSSVAVAGAPFVFVKSSLTGDLITGAFPFTAGESDLTTIGELLGSDSSSSNSEIQWKAQETKWKVSPSGQLAALI